MTDKIDYGEYTLDRASQRILLHLERVDDGAKSTDLRDAVDLNSSQQVAYRMNEYLVPSGLVEYLHKDAPGAVDKKRMYVLTEQGREWVDSHRDDLLRPADLDEAIDAVQHAVKTAEEASESASSAKTSVQNYRTKVARLKTRVTGREDPDYDGAWLEEGHEQRIESLESQQDTLTERANGLTRTTDSLSNRLTSLEERDVPTRDELDDLDDELDGIEERVDSLTERMDAIEASQNETKERLDQIDRRLESVEQTQSESLWKRLLGF